MEKSWITSCGKPNTVEKWISQSFLLDNHQITIIKKGDNKSMNQHFITFQHEVENKVKKRWEMVVEIWNIDYFSTKKTYFITVIHIGNNKERKKNNMEKE